MCEFSIYERLVNFFDFKLASLKYLTTNNMKYNREYTL